MGTQDGRPPEGEPAATQTPAQESDGILAAGADDTGQGALLTEQQAQTLTSKIERHLENVATTVELIVPLIEKAKAGNAHIALGYRSWTKYVVDKFGASRARIERAERVPLVQLLSEQGMSTRAIGSVVGAGKSTVDRDLASGVPSGTPAAPTVNKSVVGIDGKTYPSTPVAARPKPRRGSLTDSYWRAVRELEKSVERLERLHADDRFSRNRDSLAQRHSGTVSRAGETLRDLEVDLGAQVVDPGRT